MKIEEFNLIYIFTIINEMLEEELLNEYISWFDNLSSEQRYDLYHDWCKREMYFYIFIQHCKMTYEDFRFYADEKSDSMRRSSTLNRIQKYVHNILNTPPERVKKEKRKRATAKSRAKAKKKSPEREMTISFMDDDDIIEIDTKK